MTISYHHAVTGDPLGSDHLTGLGPGKRCATCRHWLALCPHGWEIGDSCYDGCADNVAGGARVGTCRRALSGGASYEHDENGKYDGAHMQPRDKDTLMWGSDGSGYRAGVYTRPAFGCVMWEGKGEP